jgi:hypothetical protein
MAFAHTCSEKPLPALRPNQMQALYNNNNSRTLMHSRATTDMDYMVHGQTSASYAQQQQQQQADCLAKHTWFKRDVRAIATQALPTATLLLTQTNNTRPLLSMHITQAAATAHPCLATTCRQDTIKHAHAARNTEVQQQGAGVVPWCRLP